MECSLEEAIELFLSQSTDRAKMQPMDIYHAALAAGKPEYIALRDICHKHNVAVKGDDETANTVGTLTSISDGIGFTKTKPELLDSMLALLGKLGWKGWLIYMCNELKKVIKNAIITATKVDGYSQVIIMENDGSYGYTRKYEGCCPEWLGKIIGEIVTFWENEF